MTLDALFPDAFLLGAGISRQSALKDPRYTELIAAFPRLPNLTIEKTVEMALLGEKLATRAFMNLPHALRTRAAQWKDATYDEKLTILTELKETLGDKSLARRRNRTESSDNITSEGRALPHQYKSWLRHPARPSCLGLAQMLIGFAKVTGAPCMLVDILVPHHISTLQSQYVGLDRLIRMLDRYASEQHRFKRLRRIAQSSLEGTLVLLADQKEVRQAHHALAIKVASEWWLVDPYYDMLIRLPLKNEMVDDIERSIRENPRTTGTQFNPKTPQQAFTQHRLNVLEKALPYTQRLDQPCSAWSHTGVTLKALVETNIFHKVVDPKEGDKRYTEEIGESIIQTHYTARRAARAFLSGEQDTNIEGSFDAEIELGTRNKRFRNQVYLRMMHTLARQCLIDIVQLPNEKELARLQEFAHPTFQLAVRTVNQMAHERNIDVPELSLYSSSQWILHDTFDAVCRSQSRQLLRHSTNRIKRIAKNPELALPEISHLVEGCLL